MSKPDWPPASWLRMNDFPVRYRPATVITATGPVTLASSAQAASFTRNLRGDRGGRARVGWGVATAGEGEGASEGEGEGAKGGRG